MSAAQWLLVAITVIGALAVAATAVLVAIAVQVDKQPRPLTPEAVEAEAERHGVDGDVIARVNSYQRDLDKWEAEWHRDGEQRG